eukprot:m.725354 g.725354  ORF g.725354 m.725354 type:complete len:95 (+) comp23028_c0_seq12:1769-2053(+)
MPGRVVNEIRNHAHGLRAILTEHQIHGLVDGVLVPVCATLHINTGTGVVPTKAFTLSTVLTSSDSPQDMLFMDVTEAAAWRSVAYFASPVMEDR